MNIVSKNLGEARTRYAVLCAPKEMRVQRGRLNDSKGEVIGSTPYKQKELITLVFFSEKYLSVITS